MEIVFKIGEEFSWDTVDNKRYEGIIVEVSSEYVYVKCTDGKTRRVEI